MNFDVTVDGRPWRVALEPDGERGRFQVGIRGRRRVVDASWIDLETLSLITVDGSSSRVREIGIRSVDGSQLHVVLAGRSFAVTAVAEGKPGSGHRAASASVGPEGRQTIVAPMPGRIARVMVAAGDRVAAGQPVIVVEAMKMENELRSPKDGAVRAVNVQAGDTVEAHAALVEIE